MYLWKQNFLKKQYVTEFYGYLRIRQGKICAV